MLSPLDHRPPFARVGVGLGHPGVFTRAPTRGLAPALAQRLGRQRDFGLLLLDIAATLRAGSAARIAQ